jgi:hypothetical protein
MTIVRNSQYARNVRQHFSTVINTCFVGLRNVQSARQTVLAYHHSHATRNVHSTHKHRLVFDTRVSLVPESTEWPLLFDRFVTSWMRAAAQARCLTVGEHAWDVLLKLIAPPPPPTPSPGTLFVLKDGDSAVHVAVTQSRLEALKLLIDARANLNLVNKRGDTPLSKAAGYGKMPFVDALADGGVDVNMADKVSFFNACNAAI